MLDKKVFRPVDQRSLTGGVRNKIIRSSMFLNEKFLSNGKFETLKARLVAGGNMQEMGLYKDTSSPTVSITAVFITAALTAMENRNFATLDIGNAYLNAKLRSNSNILMRLDPSLAGTITQLNSEYGHFLNDNGTLVVRLDKVL